MLDQSLENGAVAVLFHREVAVLPSERGCRWPAAKKCRRNSRQQVYTSSHREAIMEIPDYWLLLAEGHLSRRLFASLLRRIAALPLPDG